MTRPFLFHVVLRFALWVAATAIAGPQTIEFPDGARYHVDAELGHGGAAVVYRISRIGPGTGPEVMALKVFKPGHEAGARKYRWIRGWLPNGEAPQWMTFGPSARVMAIDGAGHSRVTAVPMELFDASLDSQPVRDYFHGLQDPALAQSAAIERLHTLRAITDQGEGALATSMRFGVGHSDIKPANFMLRLSGGELGPGTQSVLGDLDSIEPFGAEQTHRSAGYFAPEVAVAVAHDQPMPALHEGTDLYEYACTAYATLFGQPPFVDFLRHIGRHGMSEVQAFASYGVNLSNFAARPADYATFLQWVDLQFSEMRARYRLDSAQAADLEHVRQLVEAGLQLSPQDRLAHLRDHLPQSPLVQALDPSVRRKPPAPCSFWSGWLGL
jgi:serine/threonine protein kinase